MGEGSSKSKGFFGWFLVVVILALVGGAIFLMVKKKTQHHNKAPDLGPVPGPPGPVVAKYGDALKVAMQFFDVQKSGKLVDNKIPWRGDSALKDGNEQNLDLSKGMYDAGDHMKFGFPLAFTGTVLSWAILEYGDQMQTVDQLKPARESLQWITDYLINAHPSPNVLIVQVGDPEIDHKCWNTPESMTEKRPLTQINTSAPGSDVAAETAAALASASLVFKSTDPKYSASLLSHAQQLFDFADGYRGLYSENIPQVQKYYNSTGYGDELLWAASWLYHATGNSKYFDYAIKNGKEFAKFGSPTWFSWDNKLAGTQVLLSRISLFNAKNSNSNNLKSNLKNYRNTAESVMCGLLPKSPTATKSRTKNGLIWVDEWNALQHPMASGFLAVVYSDYMLTSRTAKLSCDDDSFGPSDLRNFALSQADYVLGDNPMKMSFLVGYGDKYPKYVHHRGASIPTDVKSECDDWQYLNTTSPNPNVAVGALVGGPFLNETFIDSRNNSMQTEPSTYNSAVVVALLSGLVTTSSVVSSFTQ